MQKVHCANCLQSAILPKACWHSDSHALGWHTEQAKTETEKDKDGEQTNEPKAKRNQRRKRQQTRTTQGTSKNKTNKTGPTWTRLKVVANIKNQNLKFKFAGLFSNRLETYHIDVITSVLNNTHLVGLNCCTDPASRGHAKTRNTTDED